MSRRESERSGKMVPLKYFGALVSGCLFLTLPSWAQERGWEGQWNEILAAAKREGKVVVHGPADAASRKEIPARFQARFGIPAEYVSGRSSDLAVRLRTERRAGLSTIRRLRVRVQYRRYNPVSREDAGPAKACSDLA